MRAEPVHETGRPEPRTIYAPGGGTQGDSRDVYKIPPGATHHYHFKLYALDAALDLPAGADKAALLKAVGGRVLARGELVGTYRR